MSKIKIVSRYDITKVVFDGDRANLRGANLRSANLYGADLYDANLYGADLSGANLYGANLGGANLYDANLGGADLRSANLYGANLYGANLRSANLSGAKNMSKLFIATMRILPPEGEIVGWKKCQNGILVKVLIPKDAARSNATTRKCRAEYVEVLEVIGAKEGVSIHNGTTVYKKGETVKCDVWNKDWTVECGGGIHFFLTREEAEDYQ